MQTVENIAEVTKLDVFAVENLPLQVFINYLAYLTYKNNKLKAQYA